MIVLAYILAYVLVGIVVARIVFVLMANGSWRPSPSTYWPPYPNTYQMPNSFARWAFFLWPLFIVWGCIWSVGKVFKAVVERPTLKQRRILQEEHQRLQRKRDRQEALAVARSAKDLGLHLTSEQKAILAVSEVIYDGW